MIRGTFRYSQTCVSNNLSDDSWCIYTQPNLCQQPSARRVVVYLDTDKFVSTAICFKAGVSQIGDELSRMAIFVRNYSKKGFGKGSENKTSSSEWQLPWKHMIVNQMGSM